MLLEERICSYKFVDLILILIIRGVTFADSALKSCACLMLKICRALHCQQSGELDCDVNYGCELEASFEILENWRNIFRQI